MSGRAGDGRHSLERSCRDRPHPSHLRSTPRPRAAGAALADAPVGDPALDRSGFAEFANALTLIVDDDGTATPLTIAVSAPWGGGKSSLGCMLQTMLERRVRNRGGDDPRLVVWFDTWEHDDAPHLGAALAASVVRAADRNRHWWRRLVSPLPSAMHQPSERSRQTVAIALISALAGLLVALLAPGESTASIFGGEERAASGAGVLGAASSGSSSRAGCSPAPARRRAS